MDISQDAASEISAELQGIPDLIIGNYSDGNLVATLLAAKLGVTQVVMISKSPHHTYSMFIYILMFVYLSFDSTFQCTIAHALEKTKYPESDIFWKKFDEKYHFSCQFTADLLAMNAADFIITSTYQEIAGT